MGILVAAFIKANKRAHVEAVVVNMREVGFESPFFEWQGVVSRSSAFRFLVVSDIISKDRIDITTEASSISPNF